MITSHLTSVLLIILLMIILVYFFVTNFSKASNSVSVVNNSCQSQCQSLMANAFNYNDCSEFNKTALVNNYVSSCSEPCIVTLMTGVKCIIK